MTHPMQTVGKALGGLLVAFSVFAGTNTQYRPGEEYGGGSGPLPGPGGAWVRASGNIQTNDMAVFADRSGTRLLGTNANAYLSSIILTNVQFAKYAAAVGTAAVAYVVDKGFWYTNRLGGLINERVDPKYDGSAVVTCNGVVSTNTSWVTFNATTVPYLTSAQVIDLTNYVYASVPGSALWSVTDGLAASRAASGTAWRAEWQASAASASNGAVNVATGAVNGLVETFLAQDGASGYVSDFNFGNVDGGMAVLQQLAADYLAFVATYNATNGAPSASNVTVAAAGAMYTNVTSALAAIAANSARSSLLRVIVQVAPGSYNEPGPNGLGLELLDYVDIVGAGRDRTTLNGPAVPADPQYNSTIHVPANCRVANLTLAIHDGRYAVHADNSANLSRVFVIEDCNLRHYGSVNQSINHDIGIGLYGAQQIILRNVSCEGDGVYFHGALARAAVAPVEWLLDLDNVTARELLWSDVLEYTPNRVRINGGRFNTLRLTATSYYYDLHPADPLYNRGYYPKTTVWEANGAYIGRVIYYDALTTNLYPTPLYLSGLNVACLSSNTLAAGRAVCWLADTGLSNSNGVPSAAVTVGAWTGAGILYGVVETGLTAGAVGSVQVAGEPRVLCDASAGAVTYGAALTARNDGLWTISTNNTPTHAYARGALASGTGLVVAAWQGARQSYNGAFQPALTNSTTMQAGVLNGSNGVYFTRSGTNYWITFP